MIKNKQTISWDTNDKRSKQNHTVCNSFHLHFATWNYRSELYILTLYQDRSIPCPPPPQPLLLFPQSLPIVFCGLSIKGAGSPGRTGQKGGREKGGEGYRLYCSLYCTVISGNSMNRGKIISCGSCCPAVLLFTNISLIPFTDKVNLPYLKYFS